MSVILRLLPPRPGASLKILSRPVAVEAARDAAVARIRHVDEVAMSLIAGAVTRIRGRRAFIERGLNTAIERPPEALVLSEPLRGAKGRISTAEARVRRVVRAIVSGVLGHAALGFGPALERRQADARTELIDALDAVGLRVSRRRRRRRPALIVRSAARSPSGARTACSTRSASAVRALRGCEGQSRDHQEPESRCSHSFNLRVRSVHCNRLSHAISMLCHQCDFVGILEACTPVASSLPFRRTRA
jgi:hypothetical protein